MKHSSGNGPRVLLYSQDGLGLGHLRRTSSIAGALVGHRDDVTVLTIVDSPLGPFFGPGPGRDCVKLPSIVKLRPGVWEPVSLGRPFDEVSALRRDMLRTIGTSFRPDVVLVDHMPHGAAGELLPLLRAMRDLPTPPRCVLGLRDIIDAPRVVRRVWSDEGAFSAMEECYDVVLVYGRQDVFDPVHEYGFPDAVAGRVRYTGYVCRAGTGRYPGTIRARRGRSGAAPDAGFLVATAGGGADAYPMMSAVLDAVPLLSSVRPWSAVLVTGPFMPRDQRRDLARRAAPLGVRVRPSVSDPLSYVEAADVVVAMAGYSSTVEAVRSGTPTVLVPRRGPSAEQGMRAARFAARGWTAAVEPDRVSGESVAEAVLERLTPTAEPDEFPANGLEIVVDQLVALLDGGRTSPPVPAQATPTSVPAG